MLGGGFGILARMLGFSVDNFVEAEVVLQSGEVVLASDKLNPDLMWGLRGGSGNFGIGMVNNIIVIIIAYLILCSN